MKIGDIQADRVFPITEEYQEKRDYKEQLQQAGYLRREAGWEAAGPFQKLSALPKLLRIPALTAAYAVLIFWFLFTAAWESSSRKPGRSGKKGKGRL